MLRRNKERSASILFLGTGSAVPSGRRKNTSLLLQTLDGLLLIDTSGAPVNALLAADIEISRLTDVLLTHGHTDHLYGLPSLIHSLWQSPRFLNAQGLRISGNKETLNIARQLVDAFGLTEKRDPVPLYWQTLSDQQTLPWQGAEMCGAVVLNADHAGIPTFGVRLQIPNGLAVVYSGDSVVTDTVRAMVHRREVDVLIHDCGGVFSGTKGHADGQQLNELLRGSALSRVYLVHLPEMSRSEERKLKAIAGKGFNGDVLIPDDGDVISFGS